MSPLLPSSIQLRPNATAASLADIPEPFRFDPRGRHAHETSPIREQELTLLYNNVSDVVFRIAVEPGEKFRFLSVNHAFLVATGYAEHQVIGKLVNEVIPKPSCSLILECYRKAIRERKTVC